MLVFWMIGWLTFVVFILSSWWSWWYGGSFGCRVLIDYMPVFAIILAALLTRYRSWSFRAILILLIVICQIQTYQYRYGMIHWDNMTQRKYFDVFLKLP